jgi:protein-disulfide isomerase
VASRKEQKAAARQAREQAVAQLKAQQSRRNRLLMLGGVVALVIAAIIVVVVVSSSGGGNIKSLTNKSLSGTAVDGAQFSQKAAVTDVKKLLDGIPESGNTLGNPSAPVTITEYGDLVCPVCQNFAVTSEPQLIQSEVRTGKVQLAFRGLETASHTANDSEYMATQVAARSAGLQGKEWYYVLLTYDEQPQTISGQDAETVAYVNSGYLADRAAQIPGLNLKSWQANLGSAALKQLVNGDTAAASQQGATGTPTIFVSGPKGTVQYDKSGTAATGAVPDLAELQALIAQVS